MRCLSVPCTVWLIVAALTEVFSWMWPIRDQLSQNTNRLPAPGLRQSGDGGRSRRRNLARGKGRGMLRGADLRPKHFHHLQAKAALLFSFPLVSNAAPVANIAQHISDKGGSY